MAFSFGFYNAFNHDRRYNALQISQIFDGIIGDGIYASIDECMIVKAADVNNRVIVGPGRGWFDHTWNLNDSDMPIDGPEAELVVGMNRYDAIVLDINSSAAYRENKIIWITGEPSSSNPRKPAMIKEENHHQYPLCYIFRRGGNNSISQSNIENRVGTSECPFVTGVVQTLNIDQLLLQWQQDWKDFVREYEADATKWKEDQQADFLSYRANYEAQMAAFQQSSDKEFNDWFSTLKVTLDGDVAGHLQTEIEEIQATEFNRYYELFNSETNINDDTDIITKTNEAATMTTSFSEDGETDVVTTTIVPTTGNFNYVKTTKIIPTTTGTIVSTTYTRQGK